MLQEHMAEVHTLLRQKKREYEEDEEDKHIHVANADLQGLRSPPLPSGAYTSRTNSLEARQTQSSTPQLPPMGYFAPPKSPMKGSFR